MRLNEPIILYNRQNKDCKKNKITIQIKIFSAPFLSDIFQDSVILNHLFIVFISQHRTILTNSSQFISLSQHSYSIKRMILLLFC
jgi:hypothetical protein